jgi:hypothetical protein
MVIVLALSALVSTLLGGLLALRNRDRSPLVPGFRAGVILGVATFGRQRSRGRRLDLVGSGRGPIPARAASTSATPSIRCPVLLPR